MDCSQATDCEADFPADVVDYEAVIPFKVRLLETAWTNFKAGERKDLRPAYDEFCDQQAHWLEDYALFRALKAKYNGAYYLDWPAELVQRDADALASARRELADRNRSGPLCAISAVPPGRSTQGSMPMPKACG